MKSLVMFSAGVVAGAAIACLSLALPLKHYADTKDSQMEKQYAMTVLDQAYIAYQLQEGHAKSLQASILDTLPGYALSLHALQASPQGASEALWMIKTVFERSKHLVTPEVESILHQISEEPPQACKDLLETLALKDALRESKQSDIEIRMATPVGEPIAPPP